jgi:sulfite exporter TauE/SafE
MLSQVLIPGLILGAISSFHCIGMCGPLALALPLGHRSSTTKVVCIFLYNLGRVVTYSMLGFLVGFLGRQISLAGFQQSFSIVAGILILVVFILKLLHRKHRLHHRSNWFSRRVQQLVAASMRIQTLLGFFLTGMANGLLPCGMVYLAVTGALATNSIGYGAVFMAAFGLGTFPAMVTLCFAGLFISIQTRSFIRKLTPYAFLLMGLLLITRGLGLGIPYLSPDLPAGTAAVSCH